MDNGELSLGNDQIFCTAWYTHLRRQSEPFVDVVFDLLDFMFAWGKGRSRVLSVKRVNCKVCQNKSV